MSKSSIDFGEDVCYYEDISNNFQLKYVKGCPSGKSCQDVLTTYTEYNIKTCQNVYSVSKRESEETCDEGLYECQEPLSCTSNKCSPVSSGGSSGCNTIAKYTNINPTRTCITDQTELQKKENICEEGETDSTDITYYEHYSSTKICKKILLEQKEDVENEYTITKVYAEIYSIQDGEYVENASNDYCQNGFSLYFYGNGGMKTGSKWFKRCVTVLAIQKISSSPSNDYLIKYKIGGVEHIYDTSKLSEPEKTTQNNECYFLMVKLEIFKYLVEEYKNKGNSNELMKWEYLYAHPEYYLLYKDQTDVLDYLIKEESLQYSYIPERYSTNNQPNTSESEPKETTNTTTDSTDIITENENSFSRLLNIKYFTMVLFLFLL